MTQFIQVTPLGEIQGSGDIQEQFIGTLGIIDGCQLIPGVSGYAGTDSYFDFETGQVVAFPPKPSEHHTFNWATKQWEDPRTLADLKEAQWTQIKQARSQAEYAGFTWDGSTFDSDAISQQRITGAVALAQMSSEFTIGWILSDNTVRTLSHIDMMQVGAALGQHVAVQFARGAALRAQIEAAATKEEVEAVVW